MPPGHFKLWELGFEHGDPSLANLMVDPGTGNGVLNDWDLSRRRVTDGPTRSGAERTGTIPFMAIDLLSQDALDRKVPRLYRHDLEGFIWVLVWVFLQYEGCKRVQDTLEEWRSGNLKNCRAAKLEFLSNPASYHAVPSWRKEWDMTMGLLDWLETERSARVAVKIAERQAARRQAAGQGDGVQLEPPPLEVHRKFLDQLKSSVGMNRWLG